MTYALRILALLAVTTLSACQSTGGAGPQTAAPTEADLPPRFREQAAAQLVHDYIKDGVGPATISKVAGGSNAFGSQHFVEIRYPVLGRPGGFFGDEPRPKIDRCIEVTVTRSADKPTEHSLRFERSKEDGQKCYRRADQFSPYPQLEQMAAKLRKCEASGADRCLLTTNMPEGEARRLMNRR